MAKNKKNKKKNRYGNPAKRSTDRELRGLARDLLDYLEFSACCDYHEGLMIRAAEESMILGTKIHKEVGEAVRLSALGISDDFENLIIDLDLLRTFESGQILAPLSESTNIVAFIVDSAIDENAWSMVAAMLDAVFEKLNPIYEQAAA